MCRENEVAIGTLRIGALSFADRIDGRASPAKSASAARMRPERDAGSTVRPNAAGMRPERDAGSTVRPNAATAPC